MNDEDELNEGRRLGLTVLPPHSQNNNCHNFPQLQVEILNDRGWNKTKQEDTWVISLIGPWFDNFPTLILVKIMPLSHFSCCDRSWSGYF